MHPSLLPRWRGAAPVERAILAGDAETGVTIHETVQELDAGPVAAQERFAIGPDDDAGSVFDRAAVAAARLLDDRPRRPEPFLHARRTRPASRTPTRSRPADRAARPRASRRRARPQGACALAAHRRSSRAPRAPGDGLAGDGWGRTASSSRSRSSPTEASGWTLLPGCAACGDDGLDLALRGRRPST